MQSCSLIVEIIGGVEEIVGVTAVEEGDTFVVIVEILENAGDPVSVRLIDKLVDFR